MKPFLIESSSQFRSDGPDALTSTAYATDFNEIKSLGGNGTTTSTMRTADQTRTALFWTGAGGPFWSVAARDLIEARGIDLADSAWLLAMMNLAAADASINCWNDKYHFDFWRPWTAIARALEDNNLATAPRRAGRPCEAPRIPITRRSHVSRRRAHRRDAALLRHRRDHLRRVELRRHRSSEPLHPALPAAGRRRGRPRLDRAPLPERRRAGKEPSSTSPTTWATITSSPWADPELRAAPAALASHLPFDSSTQLSRDRWGHRRDRGSAATRRSSEHGWRCGKPARADARPRCPRSTRGRSPESASTESPVGPNAAVAH